tara:strand:+ start:2841 stop:3107 length:267 start_codon:yes stop_codon:yes gene_type:complete
LGWRLQTPTPHHQSAGKTLSFFEQKSDMPILRDTTRSDPNQTDAFNQSVSSVPMAMSMMVDSMVNMMQANLPKNTEGLDSQGRNNDGY